MCGNLLNLQQLDIVFWSGVREASPQGESLFLGKKGESLLVGEIGESQFNVTRAIALSGEKGEPPTEELRLRS